MRGALCRVDALFFDESTLDDIVTRGANVGRHLESALVKQCAAILDHRWTATDHDAVVGGVQRGQADVGKQLPVFDQMCDPTLILKGLARDGRVIDQFVLYLSLIHI